MKAGLASSRRFVLVLGLLTGVAALAIDMSLPSIPEMVRNLATNLSTGQQVISLFMIGVGLGQLPAGFLSDRYGRLPVLYVGFVTFTAASIATSLSNHIEIVLAARFFQGLGASVGVVITRAIVRDVASGKQMARLMSTMVMIFTATPMLAPIIGSYVTMLYGWRMTYVAMAIFGAVMLICISAVLEETHLPTREHHIFRHLGLSLKEFFSHRQSVFALLLIIIPPAGFMSMIALSAALAVEIYGFSIAQFGLIFAGAGVSILIGATINRFLVSRYDGVKIIGVGVTLMAIACVQLLYIAWLNAAPFAWVWGCMCLYMFTIAIIAPNAIVMALDPLPKIAGVASSIIGTLQNVVGASGALVGAMIYDGTVRSTIIIMGVAGILTAGVFLLRPLIVRGPLVHHPDELARD